MQHIKRHRDIAFLVQGILDLDDAGAGTNLLLNKTRKARSNDGLELSKIDLGSLDERGEPEEWLDTSTVCDDEVDGQISGVAETEENMDWKKSLKAERKTLKRQSRFEVTTAEELERIQDALHPARDPVSNKGGGHMESNSLANNTTIDTNIAFNTHTFQYSSIRSTVQKKKLEKRNRIMSIPRSRSVVDDSQMSAILHRLGISTGAVSSSTKERTSRLIRLRGAIERDLRCVENEDRETMARMAGYWRYANRRTYNAMVRNNELWDWATGAKLEEIEEEGGIEVASTDNDEDQRSPETSESDTLIGTPQVGNQDGDFIFDSTDPVHLANIPEHIFEHRGGQMLDNSAIDLAEKFPSAEEDLVTATPFKAAAMATLTKEKASPWAGVKDTRRLPRRSNSPPSPRKRLPPGPLSPPRLRPSFRTTNSHIPRKYTSFGASTVISPARTGKSLANHLADLKFSKLPKTKISPRRTNINSVTATCTTKPPRVAPAEIKTLLVHDPPQDDDTIRAPAAAVHANSDAQAAVVYNDPNNPFSVLG